ncbi:hypothetical protein [Altererythrobacter sp. MF3-039]|uniref:hypothetical protein n=1 Tax=Altererythrobacter sp. MF3-039 TaxID=3252901 RepID=UPI00390CBBF9
MDSEAEFIDAIAGCLSAPKPQESAAETLKSCLDAWSGPPPWMGEPQAGGFDVMHASEDLTIMHLVWPPRLITEPHTHSMWATIGLYAGRENNMLWRRAGGSIEASGAKSLAAGEVCSFGPDVIHSVHNPLDALTGAIHIYGGDFLGAQNSEWDPLTYAERPRDMAEQQRNFAHAGKTRGD